MEFANNSASKIGSYSTLYCLLKNDNNSTINTSQNVASKEQKVYTPVLSPTGSDGNSREDLVCNWRCWQCPFQSETSLSFLEHIKICGAIFDDNTILPGCPFCLRDVYQVNDEPFSIEAFNNHVIKEHGEVTTLKCGYCLLDTGAPLLEVLLEHIFTEHQVPWRASPASLAYMRNDQLPHRVVTCMGCGWCTFVLRANNFAQPPTSLETHLTHCPFAGGRVYLTRLDEDCDLTIEQLMSQEDQYYRAFEETFPLVRGHVIQHSPKAVRFNQSIEPPPETPPKKSKETPVKKSKDKLVPKKKSNPTPKTQSKTIKAVSKLKSSLVGNEVEFDVPLTLPPAPSEAVLAQKKTAPTCLYVCPLCGDNALASLRERDEHLQSAHHGELVFPCQICGMAYPLYIALRRHAALKHNADYDLVRYGRPDLVEAESVECPECKLVAFTDQAVLKLHLAAVHKMSEGQVKSVSRSNTRKSTDLRESLPSGEKRPRKRPEGPPKKRLCSLGNGRRIPKGITLSRLEVLLGEVPGDHAPASCRLCHITVDNAKEFRLHLELDHIENEECEQLGCQACGRIFFGHGGRIDLIGHLRVLHQDPDHSSVLSCLQAERDPSTDDLLADSGEPIHLRPCEALFSSPRLRQLHMSALHLEHPGFACPLPLELPDCENQDTLDLSEQLRAAIMETESAADREGLLILAYCCPTCSRLFAGAQAPARYSTHRLVCQSDGKDDSIEMVASAAPIITPHTSIATAHQQHQQPQSGILNDSRPRLLESVLREEPRIPLKPYS